MWRIIIPRNTHGGAARRLGLPQESFGGRAGVEPVEALGKRGPEVTARSSCGDRRRERKPGRPIPGPAYACGRPLGGLSLARAAVAPARRRPALVLGDAGVAELALVAAQRKHRARGPGLELRRPGAGSQEARVVLDCFPLPRDQRNASRRSIRRSAPLSCSHARRRPKDQSSVSCDPAIEDPIQASSVKPIK